MKSIYESRTRLEVYVHFVWATHRRLPLIVSDQERPLYRILEHEAERLKCTVVAKGGTDDHVHVLLKLSATTSMSEIVKQMKGATSRYMGADSFKWQDGYSATGIHRSLIGRVAGYVNTQKIRHQNRNIWTELEYISEIAMPPEKSDSEIRMR